MHNKQRERDSKGRFVRRGARLGGTPSRIARAVVRPHSLVKAVESKPWRLGGGTQTKSNSTSVIREEPDPYPARLKVKTGGAASAGSASESTEIQAPTPTPVQVKPPSSAGSEIKTHSPIPISVDASVPVILPQPLPRRQGVLDPLTGRCFVFGAQVKEAGSETNVDEWKIVARGGGALPITFSALIQPKTGKLRPFAREVPLPAGTAFEGERFEWRPKFEDEHAAVLKRINESRRSAGSNPIKSTTLNNEGVRNAFMNLQLRAGALIATPQNLTSNGKLELLMPAGEKLRADGPLCAGYAVTSDGTVLGAMIIESAGKPSWIAARGPVTVAQAREAASRAAGALSPRAINAIPAPAIAELRAPPNARDLFNQCASGLSPNAFLSLLSASR